MSLRITLLTLVLFTFTQVRSQVTFEVDTSNGCAPLTVNFTLTGTGGAFGFNWDFGDGNDTFTIGPANVSHTYMFPGDFQAVLAGVDAQFQLVGFDVMDITLFGLSGMRVGGEVNDTVCPTDELIFEADGTGDSVRWDFGDGNFSNDEFTTHSYAAPGPYNVELILYSICGQDTLNQVLIASNNAKPEAFVGFYPQEVCPGELVNFGPGQYIENHDYEWDFDDGNDASEPFPEHRYGQTGTYTVELTVENSCGNQAVATDQVIVSGNAEVGREPDFFTIPFFEGCPGDEVIFGADNADSAYTYTWDFGDGNMDTGMTVSHTYGSNGTYMVSLTATNSCGNDSTNFGGFTVSNNAQVILFEGTFGVAGGFEFGAVEACPGDSVLFYAFTSGTIEWNFGDGNSGTATEVFLTEEGTEVIVIQHPYATVGTYQAEITVTNSCGNSASGVVEVEIGTNVPASAEFGLEGDGENYAACEVINGISLNGIEFDWDFGDGTTENTNSTAISHYYDAPGQYEIEFIVTNGCNNKDTAYTDVNISEYPTKIEIDRSGDTLNAMVTDTLNDFTLQWNKDGNPITGETGNMLVVDETGSYDITLTDENGCDVTSDTVNVTIAPPGGIAGLEGLSHFRAYPNPANNHLIISYELTRPASVDMAIINLLGQEVHTLSTSKVSPGQQVYHLDLTENQLPDGVYLVRLGLDNQYQTTKITVAR